MRKTIIAFLLTLLSFSCFAPTTQRAIYLSNPYSIIKYDPTLMAIMRYESNFDTKAINYKEDAQGILQIRPVMVNEANRILKELGRMERFELQDRLDSLKSVRIYYTVQNYHNPTGNPETSAKLWNGGTTKYIPQTEIYWNEVKKLL